MSTVGRRGVVESVDARDNTATTWTESSKGVPIYWLGRGKVADNYKDFYSNRNWESLSATEESGTRPRRMKNIVWTGSNADGTKHGSGAAGRSIAMTGSLLNKYRGGGGVCMIECNTVAHSNADYPYYALSPVLTVAGAL